MKTVPFLLLLLIPSLLMANIAELNSSIVHITTKKTNGKFMVGTGFNIATQGIIVTNAHVIRSHERIKIRDSQYRQLPVQRVISVDKSADLALIAVENRPNIPAINLSRTATPRKGERTIMISHALKKNENSAGKLVDDGSRRLYVSNDIDHGHSGSPVFNEKHEFLGVIYAKRSVRMTGFGGKTVDMGGYAIPATKLKKFLARQDSSLIAGFNTDVDLVASNG